MIHRIGLIRGHNQGAQGAVNYLGQTEWEFHGIVIPFVIKELEKFGIEGIEILRPPKVGYSAEVKSVVSQCTKLGLKEAVEFHFNASSGDPRGCEILIAESPTPIDNKFADKLSDVLNHKYAIKQRNGNGVVVIKDGDRGAEMIYNLKRAEITSCIIEPCFSQKNPESEKLFNDPKGYAECVALSIASAYYNIEAPLDNTASYKVESEELLRQIQKDITVFADKHFDDLKVDRVETDALLEKIRQSTYKFYLKWS